MEFQISRHAHRNLRQPRHRQIHAASRAGDTLFDRSPADYLAYLAAAYPGFVRDEHIAATAAALATLDLVVFVPIERPDRTDVRDAPKLRRRVDRVLREMLVEGAWPFSARVVEVSGSVAQRERQVLTELARCAPAASDPGNRQ